MALIRTPSNPENLYIFYSANGVEMWFLNDEGEECMETVSVESFEDLFSRLTVGIKENEGNVEVMHDEYENDELRFRPYVKKSNPMKDIEEGRKPEFDSDLRQTIIFKGSGNELRMWEVTLFYVMDSFKDEMERQNRGWFEKLKDRVWFWFEENFKNN